MEAFLDRMSDALEAAGVHPLFAGFVAGALLVIALMRSRSEPASSGLSLSFGTPAWRPSGSDVVHARSTVVRNGTKLSLSVNGETVAVPPETAERLLDLVKDRNKIAAIQLLRELAKVDLAQAKGIVDALETTRAPI
ncbi:MAG TPA: hypothetical protein VFD92_08700 [Candidatus Binatia bacterium]|nr:hypothetical protein [Candidatus Binatia bacterium]